MSKQIEALKLALEALNGSQYRMNQYGYQAMETTIAANNEAITAIREALAEQPAQQEDNPHPEYCKGYAAGLEAGAISEKKPAQQQEPVANELKLHIIRKWPEGFQDRLQCVWLDVVSFIPDVKLYDLQRVLAEFGFTMKVYEGGVPASKPWVGLTEDEMRDLEKQFNAERVRTSDEEYLVIYPGDYWAWQRAIEAKLREKNT